MSNSANHLSVPNLRFPEFSGDWKEQAIGALLVRASDAFQPKPDVFYREIGVRSHGRGVFHKEPVSGLSLGDKRVFNVVPNSLVLNIVFAWEQAVAITTEQEKGFIASHRFPMFLERDNKSYLPFVLKLLLTARGKQLLGMASPGGAGRNKTLGQQEFLRLKIRVPAREEQIKIATLIDALERKVVILRRRRKLLVDYKRGVIQQLFSQAIKFKRDDGSPFPEWLETKLSAVLSEHSLKSTGKEEVFSVSVSKGLVNQIEHLGRRYSAKETNHYSLVLPGDVVYTKSPTGNFPLGIVKQSIIEKKVIVSPLYGVFTPKTRWLGAILDAYFSSDVNIGNYLKPIVQKGAKNTINVTNSGFLSGKLNLPVDVEEQRKIAVLLQSIDSKMDIVSRQINKTEAFTQGLIQQIIV